MGSDLFLIFRMHTTNTDVYERMASILNEVYDKDTLSRKQFDLDYDTYINDFVHNTELSDSKQGDFYSNS